LLRRLQLICQVNRSLSTAIFPISTISWSSLRVLIFVDNATSQFIHDFCKHEADIITDLQRLHLERD